MSKLALQAAEICSALGIGGPTFLGAGAFKECYAATAADGVTVALKVFDPDKCNRWRASREIEAMQRCDFPHIAKVLGWSEVNCSDGRQYLAVVEEFLDGGNLTDLLSDRHLDMTQTFAYAVPIVQAIDHLRLLNLVHRDIKPDNIMFRSVGNEPVLVDFGIVRDLAGTSLTMSYLQRGPCTPYFASPEQLNNDKHMIDWRSDQFSLGVVLSICVAGRHPYQSVEDTRDISAVERVASRRTFADWFMEACQDNSMKLIMRMVAPWPVERFATPAELLDAIETVRRNQ